MAYGSGYIVKNRANVVTVVAAAVVAEGNIIVSGPWLGVALNAAGIGEEVSIDIEAGKEVEASSAVAVAATIGAAIYYNPTTGAFAASGAAGNGLVGYTTKVKNADNVFRFEKVRYITIA